MYIQTLNRCSRHISRSQCASVLKKKTNSLFFCFPCLGFPLLFFFFFFFFTPPSNAARIAFIPPGGVVCLMILSGFDVSMPMWMPMHSYFIWPQRAAILVSISSTLSSRQTNRLSDGHRVPIDIIIDSDVHISDSAYLYTSDSYIISLQFSLCTGLSSLPSPCAIHMHAHHIFAYQVSVCRVMLLIDKVLRLQRFQLEFHLRNLRGRAHFMSSGNLV